MLQVAVIQTTEVTAVLIVPIPTIPIAEVKAILHHEPKAGLLIHLLHHRLQVAVALMEVVAVEAAAAAGVAAEEDFSFNLRSIPHLF